MSQLFNDAKASGIALAMVNPKFSNAYVGTYNLNLQQAVPWGMVASIYYVGSEGKHLLIQTNANQVADAFDILNHPNIGQPSGNVQSTTFGQISSTRFAVSDGGSSRQLQISGKFVF